MSTTRHRWKDRDLIPRMQGNVARGPMGYRLVVDEHVDEPPEPSLVVEDSIREPRVASIHFIDRFGQVVRAEVDGRDAPGEFSKRVRQVDLNLGPSLRNVTRLLQGSTLSCVADRRGYITFQWRKPFCLKARRNRARGRSEPSTGRAMPLDGRAPDERPKNHENASGVSRNLARHPSEQNRNVRPECVARIGESRSTCIPHTTSVSIARSDSAALETGSSRGAEVRRSWTICATMLKAISSGGFADKSSPAGLTMRARAAPSSPASDS